MAECEICGQEQMGVYHDCQLDNEKMIENDIIRYLESEDASNELRLDTSLRELIHMGRWLVKHKNWRKMTDPPKETGGN